MRTSKIVLIGLSGNTLEVFEAVDAQYKILAILSDNSQHGTQFEGVPILPLSQAVRFSDAQFLFLIGSEKSYLQRKVLIQGLSIPTQRYARFIDPSALVSRFAKLGDGTVLHSGVTVTSNAVLGDHVMVLPQSIIHHDVTIGAYSIIGANVTLSGSVQIGESCYIGSASSIRNNVKIGDGALIGMAANVVSDVAPGAVMIGNPARPMMRGEKI